MKKYIFRLQAMLDIKENKLNEKLVELAVDNANNILTKDAEKLQREAERTTGAVEELKNLLGIVGDEGLSGELYDEEGAVRKEKGQEKKQESFRIESYDISNTSGFESVGSMVVYENGKSKKSDYRRFRIKTVEGPDDYASMKEVLSRRFTHALKYHSERSGESSKEAANSFEKLPDLILMDGGRGQVNAALEIAESFGLDIRICGMVKDDHHRTRGLYFENEELPIDTGSECFKLITRIQDETHRFAIEYHKSLRSKAQVKSVLDDIEGIGATRRRSLITHFETITAIKEADVDTLAKAPGMNIKAAQAVYDFFHK